MSWLLVLALSVPNVYVTPGLSRYLNAETVCSTKWGLDRRHVTESMKRRVATFYGVPWATRSRYEFDHLIPRELGGADDVRNLWPQPLKEAHVKDVEENRLHRAVCAGTVTLHDAQQQMRHWGTK